MTSLQTLEQFAERACAEHRVEHELRQKARRHASGENILRAEPQHADDAGENDRMTAGGHEGAHQRRRLRRVIGVLRPRGEIAPSSTPARRCACMARTAERFSPA